MAVIGSLVGSMIFWPLLVNMFTVACPYSFLVNKP